MSRRTRAQLRGTVLSVHGQFAKVLTESGVERRLLSLKKLGPLASGDRVLWTAEGRGGTIAECEPRTSVLNRFDELGRPRPVAANLDQVLVVWAPRPPTPIGFLDRYLAALTHQDLSAGVIGNKAETDTPQDARERGRLRELYTGIGYQWLDVSAHTGAGLELLKEILSGKSSAFVGQSGVGKSSLVNALGGRSAQDTGALTEDGTHGRHTTSAARMLDLPGAIRLIDSPGIRNFATGHIPEPQLQLGFPEIMQQMAQCRFRNCLHRREPGCAVLKAVDDGLIDGDRMRSYFAMLDDSSALAAERFD